MSRDEDRKCLKSLFVWLFLQLGCTSNYTSRFLFKCFMVSAEVVALSLLTAARHTSTERCYLMNPFWVLYSHVKFPFGRFY